MDVIKIHTGLDGFSMVDQVDRIGVKTISGCKTFLNAPSCLCLESLAQICALHVRYTLNFEKHAFLLKISRCSMHADHVFSGRIFFQAVLNNHSSRAFSYAASALQDKRQIMAGEFIIAVREYGRDFSEAMIKPHYKKVLSCLQNDTQPS